MSKLTSRRIVEYVDIPIPLKHRFSLKLRRGEILSVQDGSSSTPPHLCLWTRTDAPMSTRNLLLADKGYPPWKTEKEFA